MEIAQKNARGGELITEAELTQVANRINKLEREIGSLMSGSLHRACVIGHGLLIVKSCLKKGEFEQWVEANCIVKQTMARKYMRLAREYPQYIDASNCPNLSINAAVELLSSGKEVVALVMDAVNDGETISPSLIRELSGKAEIMPVQPQKPEKWVLVNHSCVHCMGRLLMRRISPKITEWICSECEHRSRGTEAPCWCHKVIGDPSVAGYEGIQPNRELEQIFECVPNPDRTTVPNAIVIRERLA